MGRHSSQSRRMLRAIVKDQGVEKFSDTLKRKIKNAGSRNLGSNKAGKRTGKRK